MRVPFGITRNRSTGSPSSAPKSDASKRETATSRFRALQQRVERPALERR